MPVKRKRLPPVKSKPPRRKGGHAANPYAEGVDREGKPLLPSAPPPAGLPGGEPTFILRASDPLGTILVRLWAGLASEQCLHPPDVVAEARSRALGMDLWRSAQNPAAGRAGAG